MKRILQITATLRIGGAEKVARDIGIRALKDGNEVHYLVFGDSVGEYESDILSNGGKVIHIPSPSNNYLDYFQTLRRLIMQYRYDVVHAHTMFNVGWAMLAAKQCGVPVRVAHAHSALSDGYGLKKSSYEIIMRCLLLRNATHLVACGDAAGIRLYGKNAYKRSGICILNGIDTDAFQYDIETRIQIRKSLGLENAFVVGHVGHLAEVKNQIFLIQLMPEILKRKPNAKLLMLGEGEDRAMLERLIFELNLNDHVIMTGNVSNVSDYLSTMDVFAFPSLYEGMPLSILEVQANGLPCVLSTGVPKDVYLTDLIHPLPLSKAEDWIEKLCGLERKQAEKYADELKEKGFDTETVVQKFLAIYESAENR